MKLSLLDPMLDPISPRRGRMGRDGIGRRSSAVSFLLTIPYFARLCGTAQDGGTRIPKPGADAGRIIA